MINSQGMAGVFERIETYDLRFPTSTSSYGSDAMNPAPDYSAAYVILHTDLADGLTGHGFAFTIGRGNEVQLDAIRALRPTIEGRSVPDTLANLGEFWREVRSDSQLRWLGPDKGIMQMAIAAVVNALWDLRAKRAGKPLWKLLSDLSPEEIVDLVDFTYLADAISRQEALALLRDRAGTRGEREAEIKKIGYPAYTTSAGWLGYSDDRLRDECARAIADGWRYLKLKVGRNIDDDLRRARVMREAIGSTGTMMLDANQIWDVEGAISNIEKLAPFEPWWIEEPTHPDDVHGHERIAAAVAPIAVAAGEHVPNAVAFKQFLQNGGIGVCQIDACRSGGVNDVLATLLMAAKFDVPVCPHAGGVGLCELVQHLSIFDYIAVSGSLENRVIEFVDQLHEHFVDPVTVRSGRYVPPSAPGFSAEIRESSRERYRYPNGAEWRLRAGA